MTRWERIVREAREHDAGVEVIDYLAVLSADERARLEEVERLGGVDAILVIVPPLALAHAQGRRVDATAKELVRLAQRVARGRASYAEVREWFASRTQPIEAN